MEDINNKPDNQQPCLVEYISPDNPSVVFKATIYKVNRHFTFIQFRDGTIKPVPAEHLTLITPQHESETITSY
jgi:hypothetical protein